ncbi:MAG: YbgC/FadM family acyl-CoA thioesterase [Pseudomonadota bacterium]
MRPRPFRPKAMEDDVRYVRDREDGLCWHRCASRILYADTDRSTVVYHANYLRYFEYGRTSLMRDAAFPYKEIEANGLVYPIIDMGIQYFEPLYYDDPMWIHTRPAELERVKLRFDYVITHAESGALVCRGFTKHCALNASGKPTAVDPKTALLWKAFPV